MTNPYQSSNPTEPESSRAKAKTISWRVTVATLLLLTGPAAVVMAGVSNKLRETRIINTRDLAPFAGNETGTLYEMLLNVWHWDAVVILLMIATVPNTIVGGIMLVSGRRLKQETTEPTA